MKKLGILMLVCWIGGCLEKPDEITPYLQKVKPLEKYHKKLVQYRVYLQTEGMTTMANDLRQVIEDYKKDMETVGVPEDKYLRAAHNNVMRSLDTALIKLVQPDFPTYVPSARKQIDRISVKIRKHYLDPLEEEWEKAGKTDPFPLKWPEE